MRTKPFTTIEFFEKIHSILKEKGNIPSIIYGTYIPTNFAHEILSEEFTLEPYFQRTKEGIYLNIYLQREDEAALRNEVEPYHLGTFSTKDTSREAMREFGVLLADFLMESEDYVYSHLEEFNWMGFDIFPSDEKGNPTEGLKYICSSENRAIDKVDALLEEYSYVTIQNNRTKERNIHTNIHQIIQR